MLAEVPPEEVPDPGPAVDGVLYAVGGAVVVEEAVACVGIPVELVVLAVLFQLSFVDVYLLQGRRLVFLAEESRMGQDTFAV